ncbi:carbohydrate kinase [Deltaproteobacteria bacterium]|nr:carbohydrate kinase [Deltaproteobacteria bacterium]
MSHILAVDLGSSYLKCALYTRALRLVAHRAEPIELHVSGPQVENDPEDWWRAMCRCIPLILEEAGLLATDVSAMSFCAQMQSVVLVDADLRAVRRSIGYLDTRATEVFGEHMQHGWPRVAGLDAKKVLPSVYLSNIGPGSPKDAIWKLRWLQKHEPDTFARAYRWLDAKDYLVARCTGKAVTTADSAHLSCLYTFDGQASRYSPLLCRIYGVDPSLLPEVVPGNEGLGGLLPTAAQDLGLAPGTPIFPGGGDISCVALGTGATQEGDTHIYLGTSAWVAQTTRRRKLDIAHFMATVRTCLPDDYLYLGELETAGVCLSWAARCFAEPGAQPLEPGALEAEAGRSPPGARGLVFTPWLHGSRSPNEDPFARGAFMNLGLTHQRSDMLRAVYEGVALHLGWILEALSAKLPVSGSLRFVGGGAHSALWSKILADVTGKRIEALEEPQLCGTRGAAFLAAGRAEPIRTPVKTFDPNAANRKLYQDRLALLQRVYQTNRPLFPGMPRG